MIELETIPMPDLRSNDWESPSHFRIVVLRVATAASIDRQLPPILVGNWLRLNRLLVLVSVVVGLNPFLTYALILGSVRLTPSTM